MSLINREDLIAEYDRVHVGTPGGARKLMVDAPEAQPEIIHCKDCEHRDPEDKKCDSGHAILWQLPRPDDWYCADAERRS